jgi:hypothetical protein
MASRKNTLDVGINSYIVTHNQNITRTTPCRYPLVRPVWGALIVPRDGQMTPPMTDPDLPRNIARRPPPPPPEAFETVEQALIWFTHAQSSGDAGAIARACSPLAVLRVIDRLWRQRVLVRDHLLVLAHYGRRGAAPRPANKREARAHTLWLEAVAVLETPLRNLGLLL